ncbi:transcription factor GAGA-like [Thrips palmi]|uniref:Transcription factor GAGA-like n=1 Tax=Thrips palmi TaxID=161013 RepID=A0A6P8YA88_THRPL|nr:transcription factor GAGA-like [Thrips palmi]
MGSSAQQYSLGWSDFDSSLKHAVKGLRTRGDLVDVTLSAGGRTFLAHKVVLSAASSLFLDLLKVAQCQHPVILLAGIGATELEQVLDFVYTGAVSVHPSELTALLQAAHILCIRGLVEGSITADEPELQGEAEAALAISSEAGQKVNAASLAAATKTDILATVSASESSCRKRKPKTEDCDSRDRPHEKWGKVDSEDDDSDIESTPKENPTITTGTQTKPAQTHVSQTIKKVVSSVTEDAPKCQKQNASNSALLPPDIPRTASSLVDDSNLIPAHHLVMNDEENKDDSYGDVAAAADAAALAASILADKKGLSDQPAACPLCHAIIRQSRNLRRHLELKHFGRKPNKNKSGKRKKSASQGDTDNESNAGSVADTSVIDHVQVEMKSPSVCDTGLPSVSTSSSSSPTHNHPSKLHTLTELQPAHQHHNVEAYLHQQQLQQLDSFPPHVGINPASTNATYQIPYPHPHPHLSMLRGDPHAILGSAESIAFRAQQQFSLYRGNTSSSNHE